MRKTRALLGIVLAVVATTCGANSTSTDAPTPVLTSIALTGPPSQGIPTEGYPMKATALYSSGPAQDVTTSATWTSSNTAVATVAPSGIVTFVAGGTARITATYQGKSGSWDVSVFPIDPSDAISIVSISPAAGTTFTRGATITFNATLQYTLAEDAGHVTAVARVNDNPNAFATITPAIDVAITKGTRSFQTTGTFTIPTSAGPTTALLFQLFPAGAPRTGVFVYAYFPVQ